MVTNNKEYMKNYMRTRRQTKVEESVVNLKHIISHNKKWVYVMEEVISYNLGLELYMEYGEEPEKINRFSKTIIYKICCKDLEIKDTYVGHTTNLKSRKSCHRTNCTNTKNESYNFKLYKFIRSHGGWTNWTLEILETFSCTTKTEAMHRETYHYDILKCTLNSKRPSGYKEL